MSNCLDILKSLNNFLTMFNKILGSGANFFSAFKATNVSPSSSRSSSVETNASNVGSENQTSSATRTIARGLLSENRSSSVFNKANSGNQSIPKNQTFNLPAVQLDLTTFKSIVVTDVRRRTNNSPYVLSENQTFNKQPAAQFDPSQLVARK